MEEPANRNALYVGRHYRVEFQLLRGVHWPRREGATRKKNVKISLPIKRNGSSTSGTLKQPLAIGGNNNKRMQFSMAKFNRATN